MADPFVAEIRIFPFNFPPKGWAFCDGGLLPLSQNTALFSILGTTYGGDGKSTFALPNLQGKAPLHRGRGAGLTERLLGEEGGDETVTLLVNEIPVHTHLPNCNDQDGGLISPNNHSWALTDEINVYVKNGVADAPMSSQALSEAGGNLPHNNMPPYLTLNFCIALQGVFPPRS